VTMNFGKEIRILNSFQMMICFVKNLTTHYNPLQPHWELVTDAVSYPFSSCKYYESGEDSQGIEILTIVILICSALLAVEAGASTVGDAGKR